MQGVLNDYQEGRAMKKVVVVLLMLILTCSVSVAAENDSFWGGLLKKINKIVSHSPRGKTYTSVVGIRGAEEDTSSDSLYWKGKEAAETETAYSDEEIDAFKTAVFLAEAGKDQKAIEAFNLFLQDYPKSDLRNDAIIAIDRLQNNMTDAEVADAQASSDGPAAE